MPKQYEAIRDSLLAKGVSEKKAKSIAAATWNKQHPDDPNPWNREKKEKSVRDHNPWRKK